MLMYPGMNHALVGIRVVGSRVTHTQHAQGGAFLVAFQLFVAVTSTANSEQVCSDIVFTFTCMYMNKYMYVCVYEQVLMYLHIYMNK